jgi:hypothetical protein
MEAPRHWPTLDHDASAPNPLGAEPLLTIATAAAATSAAATSAAAAGCQVTLLDSLRKRCDFLTQTAALLGEHCTA